MTHREAPSRASLEQNSFYSVEAQRLLLQRKVHSDRQEQTCRLLISTPQLILVLDLDATLLDTHSEGESVPSASFSQGNFQLTSCGRFVVPPKQTSCSLSSIQRTATPIERPWRTLSLCETLLVRRKRPDPKSRATHRKMMCPDTA